MLVGVRNGKLLALAALLLALSGGVIGWVLWPKSAAESQVAFDPASVQPVLNQLAPGTTFHMIDVTYRRYGAEAGDVPRKEGPETQRTETWITFDGAGELASYSSETKGLDGTLVGTQAMDGGDLVFYDSTGVEDRRITGSRMTVDGFKSAIADATVKTHEAIMAQSAELTANLGGQVVVVVEERRPFTRYAAPAGAPGFQLPYVADLSPREEIRRSYILPSEYRSIRSEVVIVSADGTETVVESRDHEAFEVVDAAP